MLDIHRRAKRGIRLLLVRQVSIYALTFIGGVVLARVLDPADFGTFGITTFLVNLLALVTDFGMSPALIQREEEIQERYLQVGFTMKLVLITAVTVLAWVLTPWVARFYPNLTTELVWLVRAVAFSLYLNMFRSISALQLERRIEYGRVAVVEVVEAVVYQGTAVGLALLGYGIWSLVWAVLARGLLGAALLYGIAPWRMRFAFDRETAWMMLRFGIPFQLHHVIGNIRNWVTPTLVATHIGPEAVGFLMWAASNGRKPLGLIQNVVRVSLPHFSRLQHHPEEVVQALSEYLRWFLLCGGLWWAVMMAAGYDLVAVIYTQKWLPAVPPLILYALLLNLNAASWIAKMALSGTGRVTYVMQVTLLTTAVSVLLSILLVYQVGFIGVPLAEVAGMLLTVPLLMHKVTAHAFRRLLLPVVPVLVPMVLATGLGYAAGLLPLPLVPRALLKGGVTLGAYLACAWMIAPVAMKNVLREKARRFLPEFFPSR
jgi:PST family polysaccharide transporter